MSKAVIKYLRLSPTKARLIARQVQGMNAELAMASLKFMPNKGAKFIANAISSAVANGGFEANEVEVVSCRVDAGAVLKRFQPRARGSASRIRKPSSHILVVVEKTEEKTQSKKAKNSSKAVSETKNSSPKAKNSSQNSTKASENSSKAVNSKENSNKAVNSSEKKAENSTKNVNSSEAKAENSSKAASEDKKAENSSSENSKTAKGEAKKAPARAKKSETKED